MRPSTFTSEKSGAFVPSGNIVLGVRTIATASDAVQIASGSSRQTARPPRAYIESSPPVSRIPFAPATVAMGQPSLTPGPRNL